MENEQERSTTFFRFEDLRIYHKSLDYINWLYSLATSVQDEPLAKSFFDRFLASAHSITLNIAEGSSRNKSQFVYYLKMAKSSVRECVVISSIGQTRAFINEADFEYSKNQLMEMTKMIGALIGSLQRSVKASDSDMDDDLD
ncbi:MAG: four helix bundle protein [Bacteroidales bacterium]|nr:four helix bundle protein [Bacteroidales bacterium]